MFRRCISAGIDILVVLLPTWGFCWLLGWGMPSIWKYYGFMLMVFYTLMETYYYYQKSPTIGRKIGRTKIRTEEKRIVPPAWFILRAAIKAVSIFNLYGFFAAISVLMMLFDETTSIHDKLARTKVWDK